MPGPQDIATELMQFPAGAENAAVRIKGGLAEAGEGKCLLSGFLKRWPGRCGGTISSTMKARMKESGDWLDRAMSFALTFLGTGMGLVFAWALTETFTSIRFGLGGSRGSVVV